MCVLGPRRLTFAVPLQQRQLRHEERNVEREQRQLEAQEKKLIIEIKNASKEMPSPTAPLSSDYAGVPGLEDAT